jgi:hypothetical protein
MLIMEWKAVHTVMEKPMKPLPTITYILEIEGISLFPRLPA